MKRKHAKLRAALDRMQDRRRAIITPRECIPCLSRIGASKPLGNAAIYILGATAI